MLFGEFFNFSICIWGFYQGEDVTGEKLGLVIPEPFSIQFLRIHHHETHHGSPRYDWQSGKKVRLSYSITKIFSKK
jgi:hypothetical protein